MKILYLTILVLFLSVGTVFGFGGSMGGPVAATATCDTSNDGVIWTPTTNTGTSTSSVSWTATRVIFDADVEITVLTADFNDTGDSDVGDVRIVLMDDNSDEPDETSEVSGSAVTVAMTSVLGSKTTVEFELPSSISVTAGTYWKVKQNINSATSDTYYGGSTDDRVCYSTNAGSTWTCTNDYVYNGEVFGCD